jgi:hypothetical protein
MQSRGSFSSPIGVRSITAIQRRFGLSVTFRNLTKEAEMYPFKADPDWYEQYWYSREAAKSPWRVPAALASLAALVIAVWVG